MTAATGRRGRSARPAGRAAAALRTMARTSQLVWYSARGAAAAQAGLALAQGLLPLAGLYVMKRAVDAAAAGLAAGGDRDAALCAVAWWLGAGAAIGVVIALVRSLAAISGEVLQNAVTDAVYDRLHAKSLSVDLSFYEDPEAFDRLHLAQEQAAHRPPRLVAGLAALAQQGVGLAGVLALLVAFDWRLGLALMLATVPVLAHRLRDASHHFAWRRSMAPVEREAGYFHWLLTGDTQAKELRLYGHGDYCRGRFREVRRRLREARLAWLRRAHAGEFAGGVVAAVVVFAAVLAIAGRLFAGALTLGGLVMYAQAFQRALTLLAGLFGTVAGLYEDALFLGAFFDLLDLRPRVRAPASPKPVPAAVREIVFDRVAFAYSGSAVPVLRDVSLTLRRGEAVALAGANGAGKTTVVKLLCRLYDPTSGRILVDGVDLREFDPGAWRGRIGVLFQDFARYQLSARDNIWVGDPRLPPDSPQVERAAERAGVAPLVRGLRHGYATLLGRWFQDGEELSNGQWQRLALARAFVREADVMVLDEPTSALDRCAAQEVLVSWRALAASRLALIVSHRLAVVQWVDRIVVLRAGAVVEDGAHADLAARGGEYARLFAAPEKA